MRKVVFVCDICQKEFNNDINIYTLKYEENPKKILSNHYHEFPSKEKWDICYNCLKEIRTKIRGW